jgi:hypothetical protein
MLTAAPDSENVLFAVIPEMFEAERASARAARRG